MKANILTFFSIIFFSFCFSQNSDFELYKLSFSNKDNFKFLTLFGDKIPKHFQIGSQTIPWNEDTFYIKGLNINDKEMMEQIERDEHNPYHSTYIFSDLKLDSLINDREKESLSIKSLSQKTSNINLKGKNFKTVEKLNKKDQFFFYVTKPVYTNDNNFAFVYIDANKEQYFENETEEYYGYVLVVFRKINHK